MQQYQLKQKIASDELTITYKGVDLKLAREVIIVLLRNNLTEKDKRDFLLLARSLGTLNHPGILPVYDMGVLGSSFFYCYRPAPEASLEKRLDDRDGLGKIYFTSHNYRMQILESLAGTIAYAHKNGISIGHLDFDSIVIGRHGEIIISNWRHSRWIKSIPEEKRSSTFAGWVQEDLRVLAEVGMRLYLLEKTPKDLGLKQWGKASRDLPADLIVALDRAYLKRPSPYKKIEDFQTDINNHIKGKASRNFQGDFLTTVSGLYRQHSKVGFYFISLCLLCFFILSIITINVGKIANNNIDSEITINRLKASANVLISDTKNLKDKIAVQEKEISGLNDELKWNSSLAERKKSELEKSLALKEILSANVLKLQNDLEQVEKNISSEEGALKEDINAQLDKIKKSIRDKSIALSTIEQQRSLRIRSDFIDPVKQKSYREQLSKMLKTKSWVSDYIGAEQAVVKNTNSDDESLVTAPTDLAYNTKGNLVAWASSSRIFLYDIGAKTKLYKFTTKEDKFTQIAFSSNENILHAVSSKNLLIYEFLPEKGKLETLLRLPNTSFNNLIPFTQSQAFGFLMNERLYYTIYNKTDGDESAWTPSSTDRPLRAGARIIALPSEKHIVESDKQLFLLPTMRPIAYNGPPLQVVSGRDLLYATQDKTLSLMRLDESDEFDLKIQHVQTVSLEAPLEKILMNAEENVCMLTLQNKKSYTWTYENNEVKPITFEGLPLLYNHNNVLLLDNKTLRLRDISKQKTQSDLYADVFKQKPKPTTVIILNEGKVINESSLKLENKLLDICLPEADSSLAIILNGPYRIELWDLNSMVRMDIIAISDRKLDRIYYSKEFNKILSIGKDNIIEAW